MAHEAVAQQAMAVLLALCAALFSAISDVIQQRSARRVGERAVGPAALIARLMTDRQWWLGSLAGVVGLVMEAAALGLGSVLLVESLLVTSLLFALPLGARRSGRRLRRSVWLWSALLVAAETLIVTVGHPTAGDARASLHNWVWVVAVLAPAGLLCLIGARYRSGHPVAAVLLAAVSATCWGVFAVLTKGVVDVLPHGARALLAAPEFYAWGAVAVAGTVYQQSSFRAGALTSSLPTLMVLEPLVAALLGKILLGEVFNPDRQGVWTVVLALATLIAAVAALSRDNAATATTTASATVATASPAAA